MLAEEDLPLLPRDGLNVLVLPTMRMDWMRRYSLAVALPENSLDQEVAK